MQSDVGIEFIRVGACGSRLAGVQVLSQLDVVVSEGLLCLILLLGQQGSIVHHGLPPCRNVLQWHHGHAPTDSHVSDMDASALNCPPFPEEDAAMIKSTRIRVGRNLADVPLGPGITNEQRKEIMQKVVNACNEFEGDLAGQFYALEGMDPATQQQLIDDHFLFK